MRRLLLLIAALAATGCGLLGPIGRYDLPAPIKMYEVSKVQNGAPLHSNDPALDRY